MGWEVVGDLNLEGGSSGNGLLALNEIQSFQGGVDLFPTTESEALGVTGLRSEASEYGYVPSTLASEVWSGVTTVDEVPTIKRNGIYVVYASVQGTSSSPRVLTLNVNTDSGSLASAVTESETAGGVRRSLFQEKVAALPAGARLTVYTNLHDTPDFAGYLYVFQIASI